MTTITKATEQVAYATLRYLAQVGQRVFRFLATLGRALVFLIKVLHGGLPARKTYSTFQSTLLSYYFSSLLSYSCTSLFMGMATTLQAYRMLDSISSQVPERFLSSFLFNAMLKEVGPVLAALLFIMQIGSPIISEIGLMKASEQLASLEMMAIDPIRKVFLPRFWAVIFALPLLFFTFSFFGILGGAILAISVLGVDTGYFWGGSGGVGLTVLKLMYGLFKSIVFGWEIAWISLFQGHDTTPSPTGISEASKRGAGLSVLIIFATNLIFTIFLGSIDK